MSAARRIRRALLSVHDKTGIVAFARALHEEFGIEIISTGGTAEALRDAGIPVTRVEDITGSPEMLDGRVKTLHARIHAAILADRDNPQHMRQLAEQGIEPIDMVVVNLYPFEQTIARPAGTFDQAIEMIDIGGPCLLRAAAKNHQHVLVVARPDSYELVLKQLRRWDDEHMRSEALRSGAFGAFWSTTAYDAAISTWLSRNEHDGLPGVRVIPLRNWGRLRYGENPHQTAELLSLCGDKPPLNLTAAGAPVDGQANSQESVSFNNCVDASAALGLCSELTRACFAERSGPRPAHQRLAGTTPARSTAQPGAVCCFIKHTNACGVAVDLDPIEAYRRAYLGDPNAAMGGILAVNFPVIAEFAAAVMDTYARWGKPLRESGAPLAPGGFFIEVWLAPAFDDEAVRIVRGKVEGRPKKDWGQRVRLLSCGDMSAVPDPDDRDFKRIAGAMLIQTCDQVGLDEQQWRVITERQPTDAELRDLRLAWLVAKHTKSNAITICKDGMLIGNGAGQMSRVMSCRIATWLAAENGHRDALKGAAAASDGFFPFRDGPDLLIDAGVTALIQPGGSKRDAEVSAACNERGVAMIVTGTRHFRH